MDWFKHYHLFLLDFDGLLVNTEEIHFEAYRKMVAKHGCHLDWDFPFYCSMAHYSSDGLRQNLYKTLPQLNCFDWETLYSEKKRAFIELIQKGAVQLMPGVKEFLLALQKAGVKRCVATHSAQELVDTIRKQNPILDSIPVWITREHYSQPKPHSECYLKAIGMLAKPGEKVIGFEDTPRGMEALLGTEAQPVLVSSMQYPEIPSFIKKGGMHFKSFLEIVMHLDQK